MKKHKALKIAGIVLLALLLVAGAAMLYLSRNIRSIISDKVAGATDGAVQVEIGRVHAQLIGKSVRLDDVRLWTDSEGLHRFNEANGSNMMPFDITIDRMIVRGIRFSKKDQGAGAVILRSPDIRLTVDKTVPPADSRKQKGQESVQRILHEFGIEHIELTDGTVEYIEKKASGTTTTRAEGLRFYAEGFVRDSVPDRAGKILYCDEILIGMRTLTSETARALYRYEVDSLGLDAREGTISASALRMVPLVEKNGFAQAAGGLKDWTRISVGRVKATGVDFNSLMKGAGLHVEHIHIDGAELDTYKNRKVARFVVKKPLYHQVLRDLPLPVHIAEVRLEGGNATYEELANNGITPGVINFNNIVATMSNVTNIDNGSGARLRVDARGTIVNSGSVRAVFTLPVNHGDDHFTVDATVTGVNMALLNKMITPLAYIEIESGMINRADITINGWTNRAVCDLTMLYDDLKITILKNDDGEIRERKFLSWLADGLIIKSSNPDARGVRSVESETSRDPYRSPWNFLWKSMFPALKRTVGVPTEDTEMTRERLGNASDFTEFTGLFSDGGIFDRDHKERGNTQSPDSDRADTRQPTHERDKERDFKGLFDR